MSSGRYSCPILMKLQISRQIFEKNTRVQNFKKMLPMGTELFRVDGQTDRHDQDNSRFSRFCEGV